MEAKDVGSASQKRSLTSPIARRRKTMGEACCGIRVGQPVPDFTLETYEPTKGDFGTMGLEAMRKQGKWTILFFYPADFTFV
jgi:peroxiredoxin (alkyl hydroperoxide reductase subunit C)